MSEKFKPEFLMAWSGVDTECERCGKTILASEWFYHRQDENGVSRRLCERCYKETEDS